MKPLQTTIDNTIQFLHKNKAIIDAQLKNISGNCPVRTSALQCITCNKPLLRLSALKKFIISKEHAIKVAKASSHVLLPKFIAGLPYFRVNCYECFYAKFNRPSRSAVLPVGPDCAFLFDVPMEKIDFHRKFAQGPCLQGFINSLGEEAGKEKWERWLERCKYTKTFEYMAKTYGYTVHDWEQFTSERCATEKKFIIKHGEQLGRSLWQVHLKKLKKSKSCEGFIEKYGIHEGKVKWDAYCKRRSFSRAKYVKIFGEKDGIAKYKALCSTLGASKANFCKKYGELEGLARYQRWKKRCGPSLSKYVKKYGQEEGHKRYEQYCKKCSATRENFIAKYGQEKGNKKFNTYTTNIAKSRTTVSKVEKKFIAALQKLVVYTIHTSFPLHIEAIHKTYFIDGFIKELNLAIEFYGTYWHADPTQCNASDTLFFPNKATVVSDIWQKDRERTTNLKIHKNIDTIVIWEREFMANPEKVLSECQAKIRDYANTAR
jgi:hypothetical protein